MADRNSIFMKADEVQEFLGVSRTESYRIIKQLNEELKASGYMIITGRVSRKYLEEKVYGYAVLPERVSSLTTKTARLRRHMKCRQRR